MDNSMGKKVQIEEEVKFYQLLFVGKTIRSRQRQNKKYVYIKFKETVQKCNP